MSWYRMAMFIGDIKAKEICFTYFAELLYYSNKHLSSLIATNENRIFF